MTAWKYSKLWRHGDVLAHISKEAFLSLSWWGPIWPDFNLVNWPHFIWIGRAVKRPSSPWLWPMRKDSAIYVVVIGPFIVHSFQPKWGQIWCVTWTCKINYSQRPSVQLQSLLSPMREHTVNDGIIYVKLDTAYHKQLTVTQRNPVVGKNLSILWKHLQHTIPAT